MARKSANGDDLYSPKVIAKAKISRCNICNQYFTENEANNKDFHYSVTKSKHEIFVHIRCWRDAYGRN